MKAGVIGLGDMGSGLAKNLLAGGFEVWGHDLDERRLDALGGMGGKAAADAGEVGRNADAVFVMVMNGGQAKSVILGENGLSETMESGGTVILTATIKPSEAEEIGAALEGTGLDLIDSPVSGGFPGAQNGTLTMMASGTEAALERNREIMEAVSGTIHRVGNAPGQGQVVKACLQSLIGAIFGATFEASTLAAKAGISGQVVLDVFGSSSAGCGLVRTALENIIDRKFENTGSGIGTMHKDLTISMDLGERLGVPLFMAATAMQIFHQGKTKYPDGDNWICAKLMEEIVGAELHR